MTLPVWDPTNTSTFDVLVSDFDSVLIDDLGGLEFVGYSSGIPKAPNNPGLIAIYGFLFDNRDWAPWLFPPMQLLPRVLQGGDAAARSGITVCKGCLGHLQLYIARQRGAETVPARWADLDGFEQRFTPFTGVREVFIQVANSGSPSITLLDSALIPEDFTITHHGVGDVEIQCSDANKLMAPTSLVVGAANSANSALGRINDTRDGVRTATRDASGAAADVDFFVEWRA